jgi:sarcosine oxidase subunit beta
MPQVMVPLKGELPKAADVVIVGGGIVGVATAFFCSRAGLETIVVEKREALGSLTTAASAECFRAQFESAENIELMLGSIEIFSHFDEVIGIRGADIGLRQQGYLYATTDSEQAESYRETVETQHKAGLTDVEFLSGDEARARFPYLSPQVVAARYRGGDGWLSVHETLYGFVKGSQAQFLLQTVCIGIALDRKGVAALETDRGTIETRRVVIAAGPFSGPVAQLAGVVLPLTLVRRHRLAVLRCELVPRRAPFTIDDHTGVVWRPEGAGALIAKAFEEEPQEPQEVVPTDWAFPGMVLDPSSPWSAGRVSPFWNRATNLLAKSNVDLCAGQYTYTSDHLPIIGPCPGVPGLFLNVGYSGHGVMGGPEGARRLAQLIVDRGSRSDNPFSYERFLGPGPALEPKERTY